MQNSLAGGGPLGEVESIVLERQLADSGREQVLRALARDADLVRALAGDPARLSALGADDAAGWQSLVVGLKLEGENMQIESFLVNSKGWLHLKILVVFTTKACPPPQ